MPLIYYLASVRLHEHHTIGRSNNLHPTSMIHENLQHLPVVHDNLGVASYHNYGADIIIHNDVIRITPYLRFGGPVVAQLQVHRICPIDIWTKGRLDIRRCWSPTLLHRLKQKVGMLRVCETLKNLLSASASKKRLFTLFTRVMRLKFFLIV